MKKKLIAVLATIAVMSTALTSIPTNADELKNAKQLPGYKTCRETIVTMKKNRYLKKDTIVGKTWTYIGQYRNGNNSGLAIKCVMNPQNAIDKFGDKIYGFSQYLKISTKLPSNKTTWQNHDPKTSTIGSDDYSLSISEAGISGSVTLKHKYCDVTDLSHPTQGYFACEYDYKSSSYPSSERTKVLFSPTYQYATLEWTQNDQFHTDLNVYSKYEFASHRSCNARIGDSVGKTSYYRVYFC